jgi:hypothetical protein
MNFAIMPPIAATVLLLGFSGIALATNDPTAMQMARLLVDKRTLKIVKNGPDAPHFTGPRGSSKIIRHWRDADSVYQRCMLRAGTSKRPEVDGAVALHTPSCGKPSVSELSFTVVNKVCV